MNKNNFLSFSKKNLLLSITPIISFFFSIYQGQFTYDWGHTAFVASGSESFLINKVLFREVFVPYGVLKTLFHAFILKNFGHSLFYLLVITSLFYSIGIFTISLIILNILNFKNALFASVIIFFIHPIALYPWHSYLLFFLLNFFIYLRLVKNNKYSIAIIPFCVLISETFFFPSLLILIFDIFYEKFFFKKKINKFFFFRTLFLYFFPLTLFFLYIFYYSLFDDWIKNSQQGRIHLEIFFKTTLFKLLILRIGELLSWPFTKFISAPQWFIFLNIILINIYVLFISVFRRKKIKKEYLYISFFSLVMMYTLINSPNVYRYATGSIIGVVTFLYFLSTIKDSLIKKHIYIVVLLITIIGFEFNKSETNPNYVYNYEKKEYVKDDYFNYFKYFKWSKETWLHLRFINEKTLAFKSTCDIIYANNLVEDSFISLILQKNLKFEQVFQNNWIEDRHFFSKLYQALFDHFNPNFNIILKDHIKKKELIIIANVENFPKVKINNEIIDFSKEMNFIKIPSHKFGNNRIIIYPKTCII